MKNAHPWPWTAGLLLVLGAAPRDALASKDYPAVVQGFWKMKKPLPVPGAKGCMLCHRDDAGNKGTVIQPFGVTIHQRYGVTGGNPSSLRRALGLVQTQLTNSDKDPVTDYTELVVDGTNPNDPHDYVAPPPPPPPASEGGQGGEAGAAGASGAGGDGTSIIEGPLPPPPPPPLEELPPPFTHGCALGKPTGHAVPAPVALFALFASFSARAGRRRRRTR